MSERLAFYPCCSKDFEEPLELLSNFADEVVFVDIDSSLQQRWHDISGSLHEGLPKASFLCADVRTTVNEIQRIDVLFYRRDSTGEGGSGIFVLGDSFLPKLLQRFSANGGFIITDGANSRGSNFKRMRRRSGLTKYGWHLCPADQQPLLAEHGLYVITVVPEAASGRMTDASMNPAR